MQRIIWAAFKPQVSLPPPSLLGCLPASPTERSK